LQGRMVVAAAVASRAFQAASVESVDGISGVGKTSKQQVLPLRRAQGQDDKLLL
jgi:hypothetical protein